jgi:hypothetical protein
MTPLENGWHVDTIKVDDYGTKPKYIKEDYYEYNGKTFDRRMMTQMNGNCTFADGTKGKNGEHVWLEVKERQRTVGWYLPPQDGEIEGKWSKEPQDGWECWVVDDNTLFSGVQYAHGGKYKGDFDATTMNEFFQDYMIPDIEESKGELNYIQNKTDGNQVQNNQSEPVKRRKQNPFNMATKTLSLIDEIQNCLEADIPICLHGKPGEGKTARARQASVSLAKKYYPNAEIDPDDLLVERNLSTMAIEEITGRGYLDPTKTQTINGIERRVMQNAFPDWYEELCTKCEKMKQYPKLPVTFNIDDALNGSEELQKYTMNLTNPGNPRKFAGFSLPTNCRIILTMNEQEDSFIAKEMTKAQKSRVAHLYVKTMPKEWCLWARGNGIHPAIISFIASRGNNVLRTEKEGDINANPRTWELANRALLASSDENGVLNPQVIAKQVGTDITKQFIEFCEKERITIDDVMKGNIEKEDFDKSPSNQYMTAVYMSFCEPNQVDTIRAFVGKMSRPMLDVFDQMYMAGDEKNKTRKKQIEKLKKLDIETKPEGGISL